MPQEDWIFKEEQRDTVCKGELCPRCLSSNIETVGVVPDNRGTNAAFDCRNCGEMWEGY